MLKFKAVVINAANIAWVKFNKMEISNVFIKIVLVSLQDKVQWKAPILIEEDQICKKKITAPYFVYNTLPNYVIYIALIANRICVFNVVNNKFILLIS